MRRGPIITGGWRKPATAVMAEGRQFAWRWKLLHGLYGGLILALSSIPGSNLPGAVSLISDKMLHFGEYGLFGLLGVWAYLPRRGAFVWLILFGIGFAGLDETWQSQVPGRQSDFADLLADVAGYFVGSFTGTLLVKRFR